jgi:hypothetical protein
MCQFSTILRALPLALLAAAPLVAQQGDGTITGSVRDARSAAPIPGASVTLDGASLAAFPARLRSAFAQNTRATRTDTLGEYAFGGVATGEYRLHVQRSGYQSATVAVALRSDGVRMEPLALRPRRVSGGERLPRMIGVGYGAVSSGTLSGPAWHAQASAAFARLPGDQPVHAGVYAMAQQGTATGSPLSCERVRFPHCLGRDDQTTFGGAGLALTLEGSFAGRVRTYGRAGGGVYHQVVRTTEFEGPAGICFEGGQPVSCSDNPPFGSYARTVHRTGPGAFGAVGVHLRVRGVAGFLEMGVHSATVGGEFGGGIPLTFGLTL